MQQSKNQKNSPKIKLRKIKISEVAFAFFIITRIIAIYLPFPCITDVTLYLDRFINMRLLDMRPYSQFDFEYPPLTLLIIYFPGIILKTIDFTSYYIVFATMMFGIDFCCLALAKFYCKERLKMQEGEVAYMVIIYSLFGLLMFRILYNRLDIVIALFFVTSLIFFSKKTKFKAAFFVNALLGFFYKIVPIFTFPSAIILKAFGDFASTKKIITKICFNALAFLFCLVAIISTLEIFTNHSFIKNMLYHEERGIQIESTYGSVLMFKNLLLNQISSIQDNYGSWNISTYRSLELTTKYLGIFIFILFYVALFFTLLSRKKHGKKIIISEQTFLDVTLISILLLLTFQRVLSTQFFIWLIPISAIWLAKNRSTKLLLVFAFLFYATFFIFSINYFALVNEEPILVTMLFLRNAVLTILTCNLAIKFFKQLKI